MRELRNAFYESLLADSATATIGTGSTESVLQVGAGEAANWSVGDVFNISGAGATLANNKRVRSVTGVDTGLDQITTDEDLPVAPASGDVLGGGVIEWLHTPTAVHYRRPTYSIPVEGLLDDDDDHGVVVLFGLLTQNQGPFKMVTEVWEFRAIGKDGHWSEGAARQMQAIYHASPSAITPAGRVVGAIAARDVVIRERDDELVEYMVTVEVRHVGQ